MLTKGHFALVDLQRLLNRANTTAFVMSGYRACSKQRHEGRGRKCFTKDRARDGKRLDEAQGRPMPTI